MSEENGRSDTTLLAIKGCLIVSLYDGLDEKELRNISLQILEQLRNSNCRGVLIDVSAVAILSSKNFKILADIQQQCKMMGALTVFVGFQPGVAAALADLDIEFDTILTAVTTDDAFKMLPFSTSSS